MSRFRRVGRCAGPCLLGLAAFAGCASAPRPPLAAARDSAAPDLQPAIRTAGPKTIGAGPGAKATRGEIETVGHDEPADETAVPVAPGEELFATRTELSLTELVDEVQRRNPTLQAALAAWGAAAERCPQAVALEDPVFQSMLAPGSFPSASSVQASYFVGISQKIPWRGKLALRGQIAQALANAAGLDSEDVRLRLAEAARLAYFDYYLVRRSLELNAANREAVASFRETARARFEANEVAQQDILQADVELALLQSRQIEFEQNDIVAVARINALLHREPQFRLPPPALALPAPGEIPDADLLRQVAIERRPDLTAQAARIEAEQAAVALAAREFYPDFEFMGRYDNFWTNVEQRGQVGMYMNIPLNQSRRKAAVDEALYRLNKLKAEYDAQVDSIRSDVEGGFARLEGSSKIVRLYSSEIIPAAEQNVASASAGYEAGNLDFLRLVEAERQLISLKEKQQEAIATYHSRRAELERIIGATIPRAGSSPAP